MLVKIAVRLRGIMRMTYNDRITVSEIKSQCQTGSSGEHVGMPFIL